VTRYLLTTVAMCAGLYAAVSWTFGALTDAGVGGAVAGAAVLLAEFAAYCERGRMHRGREAVWVRRDGPSITYGDPDEPPIYPQWHVTRGVWDFENGAPE
jgi:hypothetical protein